MIIERDYIELFHIAVRALRQDYAGINDKRALDNPNPFSNKVARAVLDGVGFDTTFIANLNAYLGGFKDKQLRLNVGAEKCYYKPFSRGYYVRRSGDGLFVTLAPQSKNLRPGDQIVRLSEFSVSMLVKMFSACLYGDIPERELWSGLLRMYPKCTVRHADGSQETIEQEEFFTPEPWFNRFEILAEGIGYLRLEDFSDGQSLQMLLDENQAPISTCKKLIIDLRRTQGTDEDAAIALIPYLVVEPVKPADVLCAADVQTLYTQRNCGLLKNRLLALLPMAEPEDAAWIRGMCSELDEKAGPRFQDDPEDIPEGWDKPIPSRRTGYTVTLLTDTYCRGIAETLTARFSELGGVKIIGRPTMGDLGYGNPVTIALDETFSLTYPISRNADADRYAARGVPVDVYIPWTPEEISADIILCRTIEE